MAKCERLEGCPFSRNSNTFPGRRSSWPSRIAVKTTAVAPDYGFLQTVCGLQKISFPTNGTGPCEFSPNPESDRRAFYR